MGAGVAGTGVAGAGVAAGSSIAVKSAIAPTVPLVEAARNG